MVRRPVRKTRGELPKNYEARFARRALGSVAKIRLAMTLALPQFVQRRRFIKLAIGAFACMSKRASTDGTRMASCRQRMQRTSTTGSALFTADRPRLGAFRHNSAPARPAEAGRG